MWNPKLFIEWLTSVTQKYLELDEILSNCTFYRCKLRQYSWTFRTGWDLVRLHLCGRTSTGVNWNNIKSELDLLCVILMLTPGHLSTSTKFQLSFRRTILHRIRAGTQPGPTRPGQPELRSTTRLSDLCWSARTQASCDGTHSANFNEKVHKHKVNLTVE